MAAVFSAEQLARAVHEAAIKHKTTPPQVEAVLERRPNAPGATKLRAALRGDAKLLLSRLEKRFIALLKQAKLPLPQTNRPAGGRFVDCRWPEHKLTVELDSYTYHHTRHAWEQDHERQRQAYARKDRFRSYTWGDVFERPAGPLAELSDLLRPECPKVSRRR